MAGWGSNVVLGICPSESSSDEVTVHHSDAAESCGITGTVGSVSDVVRRVKIWHLFCHGAIARLFL